MSKDEVNKWPARAMDLQQEPAIPDDVVWPVDAEKPDKALPKKSPAEKLPANDDVTTTKAEAKEAAPTLAAIEEDDAPVEKKTAAKKAAKTPAKKAGKKVETATASKAKTETRKKG